MVIAVDDTTAVNAFDHMCCTPIVAVVMVVDFDRELRRRVAVRGIDRVVLAVAVRVVETPVTELYGHVTC